MSDFCFSEAAVRSIVKLITPSECKYLLSFPLDTSGADAILNHGRTHIVQATKGIGSFAAQIGIQVDPCHADCGFCSFASDITDMENYLMDKDALGSYLLNFTASGEYPVYL